MIGYKVVTIELKSLGLKRNPTILQYEVGKWIASPEVIKGKGDAGGIWSCRLLSGAKRIRLYMLRKHNIACRIYKVELGRILFANNYRIKTDMVRLIEEIG